MLALHIFVALLLISTPIAIYLQKLADKFSYERQNSYFLLLANQRRDILERALMRSYNNINILSQLFLASKEVTAEEFDSFTELWRRQYASSSYGAWYGEACHRKNLDLGHIDQDVLSFICNKNTEGLHSSQIDSDFKTIQTSITVNEQDNTSYIIHRNQLHSQEGPLVNLYVITDIWQSMIEALANTEAIGLPFSLLSEEDGRQKLLHYHAPRLDANIGRPLLTPQRQGLHHVGYRIKINGNTFILNIDSSPEYEMRHRDVLSKLVLPSAMLLFIFSSYLLAIFIQRLDKAQKRELAARKEIAKFFTIDLDLLAISDHRGIITRVNPTWQRLLGYEQDELVGKYIRKFLDPKDERATIEKLVIILHAKQVATGQARLISKSGLLFSVEWHARSSENSIYWIARDITEQVDRENMLKDALENRETLLKELHHRVKNNLQIISSLLNLGENHSITSNIEEIIDNAQHRIRSMALVHEALYKSEHLSGVDFAPYLESLSAIYTLTSNSNSAVDIQISCEPLVLGLDLSLNCGIVFNELFTNANKHAFKNIEQPRLHIAMWSSGEVLHICAEDSGPGFPESFLLKTNPHLGLKIVENLARQLGGQSAKMELGKSAKLGGAKIYIQFAPPPGSWFKKKAT